MLKISLQDRDIERRIFKEYYFEKSKLFSPELHKWYFHFIHKQIHSKVPILLYFVEPKRPSGAINCRFLTTETNSKASYIFRRY